MGARATTMTTSETLAGGATTSALQEAADTFRTLSAAARAARCARRSVPISGCAASISFSSCFSSARNCFLVTLAARLSSASTSPPCRLRRSPQTAWPSRATHRGPRDPNGRFRRNVSGERPEPGARCASDDSPPRARLRGRARRARRPRGPRPGPHPPGGWVAHVLTTLTLPSSSG